MATADTYLFVYGSLTSQHQNQYRDMLTDASEFVSAAFVPGISFHTGEYPAAVYQANAKTVINGEIYRIIDKTVFEPLDFYEGCSAQDPKPWEYVRIEVAAVTEDGEVLKAQFYQYNWDPGEFL